MSDPASLTYSSHPHIIEQIVLSTPLSLHLRLLCHSLRRTIDRSLNGDLTVSHPPSGRWLIFHSGSIRLPSSHNRKVAVQIVDQALLLQRSFAGVLFRLSPNDVGWLKSIMADVQVLTISGDVWHGNRTLPFIALASMPAAQVKFLRLVGDGYPSPSYPSLHPFSAPRVEIIAQVEPHIPRERCWVGTTWLIPPGTEEITIDLKVGPQEWNSMPTPTPLTYPPSVQRVRIALSVDRTALASVIYKLFRNFRPEIRWTTTGIDETTPSLDQQGLDLLGLIARMSGSEIEDVRAAFA
ncbi:hypothetical protein CcaverHIS002_0406400 [Cutaneotrichosporon cavernicola]|nr:hypothetical protein CcaverHIS002_0406400 [Cutaneotrichosporon cavernicola]